MAGISRLLKDIAIESTMLTSVPTGKTLVSASDDSTLRIWNLELDLDSLIELSCQWLSNYIANHPEETTLKKICRL